MKSKLWMFLFVPFFLVNSACCDDLADYRYNPFQFVYPEYNYKADIQKIKKKTGSFNGFSKVNFFGLSAFVPSEYVKTVNNENPDTVTFKSGKSVFVMTKEKDLRSGCNDEQVSSENKDFCTAFSSTKDLFYKLFTLTAEDIRNPESNVSSTGILWIIHRKGMLFENTQTIHIYEGTDFTAFVDVQKEIKNRALAKNITLFHEKISPNYYLSVGTNNRDDKFLNTFLATLESEK
jgi:hypothetical protein